MLFTHFLKGSAGVLRQVIILDCMVEHSCQLIVDRAEICCGITFPVSIPLHKNLVLPLKNMGVGDFCKGQVLEKRSYVFVYDFFLVCISAFLNLRLHIP